MPFVKKNDLKSSIPQADAQKLFIGRLNELSFFTEYILAPLDPVYNMLSIYGDGGVGKSTLVSRFIDEVHSLQYKDYCLVALVDERQATPASMMEKFAEQLHMDGPFKRAMLAYKDALHRQQVEQETMQDALLQRAPDFAGAAVEGVPFVGPLLREGVKLTASHMMNMRHAGQTRHDLQLLEDPIGDLTKVFLSELNRIADTQVMIETVSDDVPGPYWVRRPRRVILIFDTFEQLATEAAPWLLDSLLPAEISSNIVLLTAGRIPLERSLPDDPKRWLPYADSGSMYAMSLNSFTEEETRTYLARRGITDAAQIDRIWRLSHGLPLYLSLLTANPQNIVDPTADVVNNFLRWIPEQEVLQRRLVLDAALFARPFSQDDLAAFAYITEEQRPTLFRWLIKQPFVLRNPQDGHYSYHEVAEELFSRHLLQSAPDTCYMTRQALATYYRAQLKRVHDDKQATRLTEWLGLSMALAQELFLLPERANHLEAVERMLDAFKSTKQDEEITRVLREVVLEQKSNAATHDARILAKSLLAYIEAEPASSEQLLVAASTLLANIPERTALTPRLLAPIYGNRGVAYRKLNDYLRAIEDFNRAIQLDPDYAWAYGNRGITHRSLRQYDEAIHDFTSALAFDDTLDWVYVGRGEAFRHHKEYQNALADFERAIQLDPDYAQAYAGHGRVYRVLKQYEQAIADFDRALQIDPEMVVAYGFRGLSYSQSKHYQQAIEDFNRAIALDPQYFWAYGSRGVTYFSLKDYTRALADFDTAIELNPTYAWGYAQRGRIYRHLRVYDKAMADLNRTIELDSQDAWSYSHRGLVYSSLQQHAKAIQDFDEAIALNPTYGRAYGRRGSAYLGLQNLEQARIDYEHNYELDPTDIRAGWMSVWIALCQYSADSMMAERLEAIARIQPQHYIAYVCRAVALWFRGEIGHAETEIAEAAAMKPDMWDAFFWQGVIMLSQGRQEGSGSIEQAKSLGIPSALLAIHETL